MEEAVTDIFVSYATEDRERVRPLVELLEGEGWSVWWDREIHAGPRFDQVIEEAIEQASCVVVVWSRHSIQSDWVRTEANEGLERGVLVPMRIDDVRPPLGFRRSQTAELVGFPGNRSGLDVLLSGVSKYAQQPDPGRDQNDKQLDRAVDITRSGTAPNETTAATRVSDDRGTWPRSLTLGIAGVLAVAGLIVAAWWQMRGDSGAETSERIVALSTDSKPSVAVLPFANLSLDPGQEFFAEGMADEVLTRLARIPDLKVISRTSSFSFKGQNVDLTTIAERLGVVYLVEGSVRKVGDRVRISVQLVDVSTDEQMWSETFERDLRDVFEIQSQIAARVAAQLNATLFDKVTMVEEIDPAAYAAFLQAHHLLSLAGPDEDVLQAEQLLDEALRLEPKYVRALLERARLAERKDAQGMVPNGEGRSFARVLVRRALALNPEDALANAYLGWQHIVYDHNLVAGAPYQELALRLDPLHLDILRPTVPILMFFGRFDDAIRVGEYVVDRDPLCVVCLHNLANAYILQSRLEDAEPIIRRVLALAPGAVTDLARLRLKQNRPEEVIELTKKMPDDWFKVLFQALAHHDLGDRQAFQNDFTSLQRRWPERRFIIAIVHAYVGETDQAFGILAEAVAQDSDWKRAFYYESTASELYELLQHDPRWEDFLRRHGIAQEQLDRIPFDPPLPI
jgi:TolB-like protein/tetratricopeptide (TPR) repeat protein